jgi:hypothetical protein
MADHCIRFTLGSHIRFGSLDFLCMGVDHDLVLLPLPCRSTMHPFWVPMSTSETWIPPTWRGSAPHHPLLSHSAHLPTLTPSPCQWLVFDCMPTRHGLPRAFSPMVLTTQGWSVSLTPSFGHDRPRKISIASVPSPPMPCRSAQGNHCSL